MEFIIIIVLLFCSAFASGSILLTSRLMKTHEKQFLRSLIYQIIFILTFGVYGIWGQFIIAFIASPDLSPSAISSISLISLLFGLPFLVFAWLMLLRFATGVSGKSFSGLNTAIFLIFNFGAIVALGVFTGETTYTKAIPFIKYYFSTASLLYSLLASVIILSGSKTIPPLNINNRRTVAAIMVTGSLLQASALLFIQEDIWMALVFAFLLFGVTTAVPVYLNYFAVIRDDRPLEPIATMEIDGFIEEYEITAREADIIKEICSGLSNQEIADKLFISLQTVKDHTHRIYIKTNVRNRMQLMTRVRTYELKVESLKSKVDE
jgi:DNA-binding CsgD family transcriptional regulator